MENLLPLSRRLDVSSEEYAADYVPRAALWRPPLRGKGRGGERGPPPHRPRRRSPKRGTKAPAFEQPRTDLPATTPAYTGADGDRSPLCFLERGAVVQSRSRDELRTEGEQCTLIPQPHDDGPLIATFINSHSRNAGTQEAVVNIFMKTDTHNISTVQLGPEESTFWTVVSGRRRRRTRCRKRQGEEEGYHLEAMRRGLTILAADRVDIAGDREEVWATENSSVPQDIAIETLFRGPDETVEKPCKNAFCVEFEDGALGLTLEYSPVLNILTVDSISSSGQAACDHRIRPGCLLLGVGLISSHTAAAAQRRFRSIRTLTDFDAVLRSNFKAHSPLPMQIYFLDRWAPEALAALGEPPGGDFEKAVFEKQNVFSKWSFATGHSDFDEDNADDLLAARNSRRGESRSPIIGPDEPEAKEEFLKKEGKKGKAYEISLPLGMGQSETDNIPVFVWFCNNHQDLSMQVYWIDYDSQAVGRRLLGPGESYFEQSYVSHPWIARAVDFSGDTNDAPSAADTTTNPTTGGTMSCLTIRLGDYLAPSPWCMNILWDPINLSVSLMPQAKVSPPPRPLAITSELDDKTSAAMRRANIIREMQLSRSLPYPGDRPAGLCAAGGLPHVKLVMIGAGASSPA